MEITTMTKNTSYLFKQSPDNSVIPYLHKREQSAHLCCFMVRHNNYQIIILDHLVSTLYTPKDNIEIKKQNSTTCILEITK